MQARVLQGEEKLNDIRQLISNLEKDLSEKKLSSAQKVQALLALRQHGTNPDNADPIYSKDGITLLAKYGVDGDTLDIRRAALRCIANALLLKTTTRQAFVDTQCLGRLAERLKTENSEDELIISRILFYTTYNTDLDFSKIVRQHFLAENINYQIIRHAKQFPRNGRKSCTPTDELALTDILKLVFNIGKLFPDVADSFIPSVPYMLKIVSRIDIPQQPLDGLIGCLVNALSMLDLLAEKTGRFESNPLFPKFNQNCNVDKLINVLDTAVRVYKPDDMETRVVPLLDLLITIYEQAPEGPRKYMEWLLLPQDQERSVPVGRSDTLSSKLLVLSTTPSLHLKTAISELMFVLSGRSPEALTKNIGYGYAAGFLTSRGIDIPQNANDPAQAHLDPTLNPITGQRWDAEPQDTGPPMTQEEKEREAERLFVLFERARANGFIPENPVAQALQEGRLEELSDDADSDLD